MKFTNSLKSMTGLVVLTTPVVAMISCSSHNTGATAVLADASTNIKTNSFTQGILNGAKAGDSSSFATNVSADTTAARVEKIKELYHRGTKNFILGSFNMSAESIDKELLKSFAKDHVPSLIAIDQSLATTKQKNIGSVWANAQEGAFLGGWLLSQYMHDNKIKADINKDNKLKFGYIGGFRYKTVTDFYYGVINGIKAYEKSKSILAKDAIEIIGGNGNDNGFYPESWNPTSTSYQKSWKKLTDANPDVVMGSPENVIIYNSKHANKIKWIGTDIDATKQFPDSKADILLSIRKNISVGISVILKLLKNNNNDMSKLQDVERFFKGGIKESIMDLKPGIITADALAKVYNDKSAAWTQALDVSINNVSQK